MPRRLGEILREPVLLAAAGGGLLALAWRRDRRVRLGAAAGLLALAAFCVLAAAGLPIITRYLLLTATLLAIFAGAGVFGWLDLLPGRERTWWARFAPLALVALLAFVPEPGAADRPPRQRARHARRRSRAGSATSSTASRCAQPIAVPNRRPIPLLALWLEARPARDRRRAGRPAAARQLSRAGDARRSRATTSSTAATATGGSRRRRAGFALRDANAAWRLYEQPAAGRRYAP